MVLPTLTAWLAAVVHAYETAAQLETHFSDDDVFDVEPESPAGLPPANGQDVPGGLR